MVTSDSSLPCRLRLGMSLAADETPLDIGTSASGTPAATKAITPCVLSPPNVAVLRRVKLDSSELVIVSRSL